MQNAKNWKKEWLIFKQEADWRGNMIKYADIVNESVVDGLGVRVTAFLQGCPRHCPGCHNPLLLSSDGGTEIGEEELADLLLDRISPIHRGITFSGGDPLAQADALLNVIFLIRRRNPALDIWVYTGYDFQQVKELPVMRFIDVLVDGPFILEQRDLQAPFRGSKNQRIIDVRKSLESNEVIELVI